MKNGFQIGTSQFYFTSTNQAVHHKAFEMEIVALSEERGEINSKTVELSEIINASKK